MITRGRTFRVTPLGTFLTVPLPTYSLRERVAMKLGFKVKKKEKYLKELGHAYSKAVVAYHMGDTNEA